MIKKPTRKGAVLDVLLTSKEELIMDVKVRDRLVCSDHKMVGFMIL